MTGNAAALAAAVLFGGAATVLWGVFDALRAACGKSIIVDFVLDTVWWITAAAAFCVCMWYTVNMRLRGFEFFGAAIGALLAGFLILKPIKRVFEIIFKIFFKIIRLILKILLTPYTFLYKILVVPINRVNRVRYPKKEKGGK